MIKNPDNRKGSDIIAKSKFVKAKTAEGIRKQKAAIKSYYVNKKGNNLKNKLFPSEFPFWARLKISKNRTTLVIDEERSINNKTKKVEDMFVHREAIHTKKKDYEEISPNPDPNDSEPMYLKRPSKLPKTLFNPHNKQLNMPKHLKERYSKNNK